MIPNELEEFFGKEGGHSLIIKGEPGSGKTTLALEILNHYRNDMRVMYLSTRVADEVIARQFPWVKEVVKIKKNGKKINRENLNKLEGLIEEGFVKENVTFTEDEAILEVGEILPEMEKIYDFVESETDKKALVCVDSIDGLSEKYGIPPERILFAIQKDIVESGLGNIVFVMEETSTKDIDYLGDGIIILQHEPHNKFWKRVAVIKKLRGAKIKKPRYLYTLDNGRFQVINYSPFSLDSKKMDMTSLINFLKDYSSHRCLNFSISDDFPRELVESFILSLSNISKTALIVPPMFYPGSMLEKHAKEYGGDIKIIGFGNDRREMYLEGSDMLVEFSPDMVKYYGGEGGSIIISVDSIAHIYGDLKDLPSLIKDLKELGNVVLLTPEGYRIGGGVDYEIKLAVIEDLPVVISDMAYGIKTDNGKISLIPLV